MRPSSESRGRLFLPIGRGAVRRRASLGDQFIGKCKRSSHMHMSMDGFTASMHMKGGILDNLS